MENKTELIRFLQKAKKKTFASRVTFPKRTKDGGKEYVYEEGNFVYRDRYYGSVVDTGQELVWFKKRLIWSMAYRGGMISHKELSKECFSFLKKCLRNVPLDFPVRGPEKYQEGRFRYENTSNGTIESFIGEEKIFFKGEQVYVRNYLGGSGNLVA